MTAKEFLSGYREALYDERRIQSQIDDLKERATSLRLQKYRDTVQGGKQTAGHLSLMDKAIDLEINELNFALEKSQQQRRQVAAVIEAVADGRYRELLTHRYINRKNWDWIANCMGYSRDYLARELHRAALAAVSLPTAEQ